ncbi:peptidoglycan recognition family protein [Paenibacillus sp. FSL P4-0176]|uniref:peptidoglycan recognition protein family protein n=1 Tax=Paenibacillus sp. FSL P4-0176 TaxID=2921631 RepID=UPI0030CA7327
MIQKGNFLLLDIVELRSWLQKQKITRSIDRLQVHHTASPNYATRQLLNGIAKQDIWKCLEGMRTYHLSQGWSGTGQNITVTESGQIAISLDRDLNKTPAGIAGSNTGAICIEIIGNFDKGGDTMTDNQKQSVIHLYACLAEKLNLSINTDTVVYHAWYTPKTGTRLSDFIPGKSSKTCPGTNFWGDGNSIAAANRNFIPQIKAELDRLRNNIPNATPVPITKPKDDEPMTEAEKLQVATLEKTIQQQADWIKAEKLKANMECPTWAQEAYKYYKDYISDTTGSYDFWRQLVINYRKDNNIKVSK